MINKKEMKEFISKYKIEILIVVAILVVMTAPYFILSSGIISSTETLENIQTITKELTPVVIGVLCALIVYRAIKRNKEER